MNAPPAITAAEPTRDLPGTWPSRRRARSRAAGASVVIGVATGALPMIAGGPPLRAQLLLAAVGIAALLLALLGRTSGFVVAAIALAAEYSLRLISPHGPQGLDGLAVIEAVALFATIELGLQSLDARTIAPSEPNVRRAASRRLAAMLTGSGASAFVVLAIGSRELPAPTIGLALGLAAATALLVSAELLRRRNTHRR
jgi:hypothetical protein